MKFFHLLAAAAAFVLPAATVPAAIIETYTYGALNQFIPDGDPSGGIDSHAIQSQIDTITSVTVSVEIDAATGQGNTGFNGDLYLYLQHGTGTAILLNRVGVTASNAFGYGDNGLNVTFSDSAASDIHLYQAVTVPSAGSPLGGTWQPDGRAVDPNAVLDSSPRTSFLSSFNGLNASGDWTLFAADLSTGAEHVLKGYSIQITGSVSPIPEPGAASLMLSALAALGLRRRR